MAEQEKSKRPPKIWIKVEGVKYEVPDPLDLTFAEASLVKRLSGAATPDAILGGMIEMDADVFPAMVLIAVQRVNPQWGLEDVGKLTWREMSDNLEREEEPPAADPTPAAEPPTAAPPPAGDEG